MRAFWAVMVVIFQIFCAALTGQAYYSMMGETPGALILSIVTGLGLGWIGGTLAGRLIIEDHYK